MSDARIRQIFKDMNAKCQYGGCHNHSGHERCNLDEAWDTAAEIVADEEFQKEFVQDMTGKDCYKEHS